MNGHHGVRVHGDARDPHTPGSCSEESDDRDWRDEHFGSHAANKRFKVSWDNPRGYGRYGGMYDEFGFLGRNLGEREEYRRRQREVLLCSPPALHRGCPKPLRFWSRRVEREYFILSGSFVDCDGGCIYRYDYLNDSWDRLRAYDAPSFKPYNAGHAINPASNELYIFGGVHKTFGLFDLEHHSHGQKQHKIYDISKHKDMTYWHPVSVFIPNELHILAEIDGQSLHSIYFPSKLQISKRFVGDELIHYTAHDDAVMRQVQPIFYGSKVVYVRHNKEILLFNGINANIYIWKYSNSAGKWELWRCDHGDEYIVLPKKNTNNFDVTIVHDEVIMICYLSSKEIWAKNIKKEMNDGKWYRKNVKQFVGITEDSQMLATTDSHYVHFINTIAPKHCMIWMYFLLPRRIIKRCYAPMVARNQLRKLINKDKTDLEIPQSAITLVSNYCVNMFY